MQLTANSSQAELTRAGHDPGLASSTAERAPDVVIITGLSGSGMSSATNAFEDLGYFCIDNLPLTLLPTFARLVQSNEDDKPRIERAALVINVREGQFLSEFKPQLQRLRADNLRVFVLFLEAADEVLQRRFSETRRPHPADQGDDLLAAIQSERRLMSDIRQLADTVIYTSEHTVHTLRRLLIEGFNPELTNRGVHVQVLSFGHKYGGPRDVDLLFDVRHLPNPHFVPELRDLSGHDRRVGQYLKSSSEVAETICRLDDLVQYLLPLYQREGKSYVNIGIGCTGGRHRSVFIANTLARRLRQAGFDATAVHRDVRKAATRRRARRLQENLKAG